MIHPPSRFRLPLVHHFMQQGIQDFRPGITLNVVAVERDFHGLIGLPAHGHMPQPAPHAPAQPKRQLAQPALEVLVVEAPMGDAKALDPRQVARRNPWRPPRRGCPMIEWECQKPLPCREPLSPPHKGRQEPYDGLQYIVRRLDVTSVNAQHPAAVAEQHDAIAVQHNSVQRVEAEGSQPALNGSADCEEVNGQRSTVSGQRSTVDHCPPCPSCPPCPPCHNAPPPPATDTAASPLRRAKLWRSDGTNSRRSASQR